MTPKLYRYKAEWLPVKEIAAREGVSTQQIYARREGNKIREGQNLHARSLKTYIAFNGEIRPLSQWARKIGIGRRMLADRLDNGWPVERALTEPNKRTAARK